jgi:hypothetical protein
MEDPKLLVHPVSQTGRKGGFEKQQTELVRSYWFRGSRLQGVGSDIADLFSTSVARFAPILPNIASIVRNSASLMSPSRRISSNFPSVSGSVASFFLDQSRKLDTMRNPIAVTNISRRKLNAACTTGWLSIFHIDSKPNYQETLEPPTHHPMQFGSPKSSSLWSDSSYSLTLSQNQQSPEKTGMLVDSPLHAGNWMPEELDAGRTGGQKNWRPELLDLGLFLKASPTSFHCDAC